MGNSTSQLLVECISTACSKAGDDAPYNLFLNTPEFVASVKTGLEELSPEAKAAFARQLGIKLNRTPPRRRNAYSKSTQAIELDERVKDLVPIWASTPSTLFIEPGFKVEIGNDAPADIYRHLSYLTTTSAVQTISRRFLLVAFHELKEAVLGGKRFENLDGFVDFICRSDHIKGSREDVRKNCKSWVRGGKSYNIISKELGGRGALFLLPHNVVPQIWEHDLPMSGNDHDEMITALKSRGICKATKEGDLHVVGKTISQYLHDKTSNWITVQPSPGKKRRRDSPSNWSNNARESLFLPSQSQDVEQSSAIILANLSRHQPQTAQPESQYQQNYDLDMLSITPNPNFVVQTPTPQFTGAMQQSTYNSSPQGTYGYSSRVNPTHNAAVAFTTQNLIHTSNPINTQIPQGDIPLDSSFPSVSWNDGSMLLDLPFEDWAQGNFNSDHQSNSVPLPSSADIAMPLSSPRNFHSLETQNYGSFITG